MSDATRKLETPIIGADSAHIMLRRALHPEFAGQVIEIVGYREYGRTLSGSLEMAPLVVPLIISFGEPFEIALGRAPTGNDRFGSFTSGLYPGYVMINSTGRSECIQIDFTPLGAYRFFGLPMREIANRMVTLDDLADPGIAELRKRLGDEADWDRRFDLVDRFLRNRLRVGPSGTTAVAVALAKIMSGHGSVRISELAKSLGWSRKHLNDRFHDEVGIGPKAMARMVRFNRVLDVARGDPMMAWAEIAAECGYSDQAHMVRDFREFSSVTPGVLPAIPPARAA